jgi:hypothetical protein
MDHRSRYEPPVHGTPIQENIVNIPVLTTSFVTSPLSADSPNHGFPNAFQGPYVWPQGNNHEYVLSQPEFPESNGEISIGSHSWNISGSSMISPAMTSDSAIMSPRHMNIPPYSQQLFNLCTSNPNDASNIGFDASSSGTPFSHPTGASSQRASRPWSESNPAFATLPATDHNLSYADTANELTDMGSLFPKTMGSAGMCMFSSKHSNKSNLVSIESTEDDPLLKRPASSFRIHPAYSTGKRADGRYQCGLCQTAPPCFDRASEYHKHLDALHTIPYLCTLCSGCFGAIGTLRRHFLEQHTAKNKAFRCPIQGCTKKNGSSRKMNLQQHMEKSHPGVPIPDNDSTSFMELKSTNTNRHLVRDSSRKRPKTRDQLRASIVSGTSNAAIPTEIESVRSEFKSLQMRMNQIFENAWSINQADIYRELLEKLAGPIAEVENHFKFESWACA